MSQNTKEVLIDTLKQKRTGIKWWYNEESQAMLNRGYLLENESLDDAIERITTTAAANIQMPSLASQFREIIEKGWISLSSPTWANMGTERGLPISCFNSHIGDSVEAIADKLAEVIMQTKLGGGTSAYFGDLRGRGETITNNGKSSGAVSFMELFNSAMNVVSQGNTRRGAFAAYLDIDHPDIEEFLRIKDIGNPMQNIFFGVCVPDYWMQEMIDGDKEKQNIWVKVLTSRKEKGMPYIFYIDNANSNKPLIYKERDLNIKSSNLCSEIMLPSTKDESFVCCLASMNLELYDEWKDTNAVQLAVYFLDGIMEEFIKNALKNSKHLIANLTFAIRHRALGLGVLGWHSYLQKNMIPFDSMEAKMLTTPIFSSIQKQAYQASEKLGEILGYAPIFDEADTNEVKRRNTTLLAIAPTTSSSSILGQVSPGIEPYVANYFKVGLAKGNFMRKNPYLEVLLEEKGKNTEEIWRDIMLKGGSVQHLDFLTDLEKDVFKTFKEVSQLGIIQQASIRQKYIDQGQSVNINIPPDFPTKNLNSLYIEAWKLGLKALYYQRNSSVSKELVQNLVSCSSCEV